MMDNMRTYKSETKKQQQQNAHLLLKNSIMRKKNKQVYTSDFHKNILD